jgi:hypothetical protein
VRPSPALSNFAGAADELREHEFSRLAASVVPTVEALRSLALRQVRACVATTPERLGYELLTLETAADLVTIEDGKNTGLPSPRRTSHRRPSAI